MLANALRNSPRARLRRKPPRSATVAPIATGVRAATKRSATRERLEGRPAREKGREVVSSLELSMKIKEVIAGQ